MNVITSYEPVSERYRSMQYRKVGRSGLQLPIISLGLWQNFGFEASLLSIQQILRTAFDHGITHFDLANNYGPPYGSAEIQFGEILRRDFLPFRDELIISTKAGYDMWPGPYGNGGSRKYLLSSLDQSLSRMGLDWSIFFIHIASIPKRRLKKRWVLLPQQFSKVRRSMWGSHLTDQS